MPAPLTAACNDLGIPQVEPLVVTGGEQGAVDLGEDLRKAVPDRQAPLEGENTGPLLACRAVPYRRIAFVNVDLIEREGAEADLPLLAAGKRGEDRLVGVSGERAEIVVSDDESEHGASVVASNRLAKSVRLSRPGFSSPRADSSASDGGDWNAPGR